MTESSVISTNTASGVTSKTPSTTIPASTDFSSILTTHKLDGKNYLKWSKTVEMGIAARSRGGYLTGATKRPEATDPLYQNWYDNDALVRTWLIHSMKPNIGENYLLHSSAKAIWDAAKTTYSTVDNTSALFRIETQLFQLKQGDMDVTDYFNLLGHHWLHLDMYEAIDWETPGDQEKFKQYIEKKRTLYFLLGLNQDLDEIKGRMMGMKPFPSIEAVFAEILREESRRLLMLPPKPSQAESSALAVRNPQKYKQQDISKQTYNGEEPGPYCDNCHRHGHVKAECFYIIGFPAGWKSKNEKKSNSGAGRRRAHMVTASEKQAESEAESTPFTKEQANAMEKFFKLMTKSQPTQQNTSDVYSSHFASQGNPFSAHSVKSQNSVQWIVDSGCSDHMTGSEGLLLDYQRYSTRAGVRIADGSLSPVEGIGRIRINQYLELFPVLHVPKLSCNLISISQLTRDLACTAVFSSNQCSLQEEGSGKTIGTAKRQQDLFIMEGWSDEDSEGTRRALVSSSIDCVDDQIMLWHTRLGHPSFGYLERLLPKLFMNKSSRSLQCETCQMAKHTRSIYSGVKYRPTQPFAVIHSDIWGPTRVKNINGAKWFVTFIDDHTRLTWTFLMREKSETPQTFQEFYDMILTQFNTKIQVLKTDNAHDYFNSVLGTYLSQKGIIHCSSCVDTPQQNGIAERKNRHLLETARALLFTNQVPKHLWGEAVLTATYLINRLPSRILQFQTPREVLIQTYPHVQAYISDLEPRVFGCVAFVHVHKHQRSKLDPRAQKCIFIGYASRQKGYKCYSPITRKVFTTMDITFFEKRAYYTNPDVQEENIQDEQQDWDNLIALENFTMPNVAIFPPDIGTQVTENIAAVQPPIQQNTTAVQPLIQQNTAAVQSRIQHVYQRRKHGETGNTDVEQRKPESTANIEQRAEETAEISEVLADTVEGESTEKDLANDLNRPIALRKGTRVCTQHPIQRYVHYGQLSPQFKAFTTHLDTTPRNISEAMKLPQWRKAVEEEIAALEKNGTWKIVSLPSGKRVVDCKWLFTTKYNSDGSVERYKARLVARGFTQSYGVDYEETFAPVAKLKTIRILLSLAVNQDWPLYQMDIKNAFLNGHLTEEVYMEIPEGVQHNHSRNSVCKLEKSLYGLKQSPRAWFERFSNTVKSSGYTQCQTDDTMFVKHRQEGKITILIVYVDDIIITGNDEEEIQRLKGNLKEEFELKDLGEMKYFLGMEVARSHKGITISQRKYVLDLLDEVGMTGCKPAETPMQPNIQFSKSTDGKRAHKGRHQQLVGKLIYLSHTRPDITYAVSIVSQFMSDPTEEHMAAVIYIIRYLKKTPGLGLMFKRNNSRIVELYTDASWASEVTSRRSTTGYCSYVWGNLVTWRSKKQSVVARSSAEAEYRALALGIQEAIWIQRVLKELNHHGQDAIHMFCDSQAALSIVKNPVHHDRTKHVEIDRHFITEKVEQGIVDVSYVPSRQQTADILTKALSRELLEHFKSKLGLLNIYIKLEEECRK
ncbi:Retrovirus-related Pol polyprotein from transposon TNT 1-94 [Linum grandiflorum]